MPGPDRRRKTSRCRGRGRPARPPPKQPPRQSRRRINLDAAPRSPLPLPPARSFPLPFRRSPRAAYCRNRRSPAARSAPPLRPALPFATTTSTSTSPLDLSAVKQALDLVRKNRARRGHRCRELHFRSGCAQARGMGDPAQRRHGSNDFSRYANFIADNPTWPSVITLTAPGRGRAVAGTGRRRRPRSAFSPANRRTPQKAISHMLARCLRKAIPDRLATVRETWRNDGFSSDLEAQARDAFAGLITPADDEARMDARLYVEDNDAAMRAAQHLDATAMAIAKARAAVNNQGGQRQGAARCRSGGRPPRCRLHVQPIQCLRHADNIEEAAQWMLAAPRDPDELIDADQWWIERRLIARKLLDLGDAKPPTRSPTAPRPPVNENYSRRAAFHRRLDRAALPARARRCASAHFARIAEGVSNPITLARSYYWQGRAAEARPRAGRARLLRDGGALSDRLLRPAGARPARARRCQPATASPDSAADTPAARTRPRLRDPLRHRRARPGRRHGGRPRRQGDRCGGPGDARGDHRRTTTTRARRF